MQIESELERTQTHLEELAKLIAGQGVLVAKLRQRRLSMPTAHTTLKTLRESQRLLRNYRSVLVRMVRQHSRVDATIASGRFERRHE